MDTTSEALRRKMAAAMAIDAMEIIASETTPEHALLAVVSAWWQHNQPEGDDSPWTAEAKRQRREVCQRIREAFSKGVAV